MRTRGDFPDWAPGLEYRLRSLGKKIFVLAAIFFLLPCCGGGSGGGGSSSVDTTGAMRLAWDASPDSSVVGYWVYYGDRSGIYQSYTDTGPVPNTPVNFTLTGLAKGQIYYLVVSAYDQYKNESDFSNEVSGVAR
jgi:hypothetical protein